MTREQIIETMARAMVGAEYERNPNHSTRVSYHRDDAAAALSALEAAGLVIVPAEPLQCLETQKGLRPAEAEPEPSSGRKRPKAAA